MPCSLAPLKHVFSGAVTELGLLQTEFSNVWPKSDFTPPKKERLHCFVKPV